MFQKVLIANRGEIALRIHRACKELGIATVAVHSTADANAMHVRLADESVCIGPPPARDSYLNIPSIVAACEITQADAVHPGYGFLSENARFARILHEHKITFIGPSSHHIEIMGDKITAKQTAKELGIPVVPGSEGEIKTPEDAIALAKGMGYPVIVKATAGGGGRGMKVARNDDEMRIALSTARTEAKAAFGNDSVYIEKYLQKPRHIEIQVFGDTHGDCVYLFERDCSVQRRHQKVLEEAPAPGMTPARRAAMGNAAVAAAQAVGYVGAGTVEFIVNQDGTFYFMEMNTRLQVEHPVTEMITGLDLVEWQLTVAAGLPLPLAQDQLTIKGHALEARIYAEDPDKGFLPATGRLTHLVPPAESLHVRVDTGVEQDDEISPHYDPMIAKLIVWDESRERALARMLQALADYRIVGVTSNVAFLTRLVACPSFARADLDTGLIEREHAFLFPDAATTEPPREAWLLAALAELLRDQNYGAAEAAASGDPHSPWHRRDGWRANGVARREIRLRAGSREQVVTAAYQGSGFLLECAGRGTPAAGWLQDDGQLRADLDGRRLGVTVVAAGEKRHVFFDGMSFIFAAIDPLFHAGAGGGAEGSLTAPMPGKVIALLAECGAPVEKGAPLLVLEAMKMEHTLVAPAAGTVKAFCYAVGEQVTDGAELLEFEPAQPA